MPTPNWGPQNGVPMDNATFNAYIASNPPDFGTENNANEAVPILTTTQVDTGGGSGAPGTPVQIRAERRVGMPPAGGKPNENTTWWDTHFRGGPAAVQMPTFQTGNQDQARLQQMQVIQDLQRQAAGDLNSRAQQQLQQGYGAAQSQQSSLGSTMRGQSAGAAMRGVQAGQQGIQRGLAGDQQMLMAQEQQAAQAMMAQLLAQQQGQDITQATGMAAGVNQGNALEEAIKQFYVQQGSNLNLEQGQIASERNNAQMGFDLEGRDTTNRLLRKGAGALATGAGTFGSMGSPKPPQQSNDDGEG